MLKTSNFQPKSHLITAHSTSYQHSTPSRTLYEGTRKRHMQAYKHPKHTDSRMENDITHQQNIADHKLVTQNIEHTATNHASHITSKAYRLTYGKMTHKQNTTDHQLVTHKKIKHAASNHIL